jgi:hypothetical protein
MTSRLQTFLFGAGLGTAFLFGQWLPRPFGGPAERLEAQGRGPVNPPPVAEPGGPAELPSQPTVVYSEESGHSSSGNGFVAVTGSYGVGTSVLYVIDTVNRQLAVYEARGGGTEQRRVMLVGARRIDLDLQLEGYNDRSEYEYRRLKDVFEKRGAKDAEVRTGLEPDAGGRK